MTDMQPPGWAGRATLLDDNAAHQIRVFTAGTGGNRLVWSCTCTRTRGNHRPLGPADGFTVPEILAAHQAHVAATCTRHSSPDQPTITADPARPAPAAATPQEVA